MFQRITLDLCLGVFVLKGTLQRPWPTCKGNISNMMHLRESDSLLGIAAKAT